eukprot:7012107-Prymnesium_polylepis.1
MRTCVRGSRAARAGGGRAGTGPPRRCGARRQITLSLCLNGHHTPQTMSKGTPACAMWVCPRVQGTE